MKHRIDPKVDCVFKALLGSEANRDLLIHFLNAILAAELAAPITEVEILNPYNEKEFLDDKLSIVDVKARDGAGKVFQVEVQLSVYGHLATRMAYTWADIYSQQLQSGQDYRLLKATYSIWLLAENLIADEDYAHNYKLRDEQGRMLLDHGGIWVLELAKFDAETIATDQQRWLMFFKTGDQLDDANLPEWMNTEEMRKAMSTLKQFSEKERDYHAYQARQNYLREQRTIQGELEELGQKLEQERLEKLDALGREQAALQEKQAALQREAAALQEKQAALQEKQIALQEKQAALQREESARLEIERLKALLNKQ
ncbi:MAG: Rpn family recombination-promoting nuclease/putative transposase [Methylococcales bacterium]